MEAATDPLHGGRHVARRLKAHGVTKLFTLSGGHLFSIYDGCREEGIDLVDVRHEQTAGYAADGYARATGRLGVAITTTGPGASNVVTAVGEAWASHSPLLVIATDIPSTVRRPGVFRGVLHETTDQAGFFRPVTKAQVRVTDAARLAAEVAAAGRLAMEHPRRPVYVEIPTDLLTAPAPVELPPWTPSAPVTPRSTKNASRLASEAAR